MSLSGRVPLLLALGFVPVVLRPALSTVWLWLLVVTIACLLDYLLAPKVDALGLLPAADRVGADELPDRDHARGRQRLVADGAGHAARRVAADGRRHATTGTRSALAG